MDAGKWMVVHPIDEYTHDDYARYLEIHFGFDSTENPLGFWAVVMRDGSGIFVVDSDGEVGEEKVRAGPFDTIEEAKGVAILMHKLYPLEHPMSP